MIDFTKRIVEFFRRRVLIGHVSGIPVHIDYRWFFVFLILALVVAANIPSKLVSLSIARFVIGLFTVALFFWGLFLHEYAHALAARREGIGVMEIELHPFGGVARLRREPDSPGSEFRIALAGPLASLIIALFCLGLYAASKYLGTNILTPIFLVLFLLNLLLAVFNLFPGFPLDGGRVLRAVLRKRGMEIGEATRLTGKFGQFIGFALVFMGIGFIGLIADIFLGIWSMIVGLFLLDTATGFVRGVDNFENLTVEQVMELPVPVDPEISLMDCIDKVVSFHLQTVFPVAVKRELYGFLSLADIKKNFPKDQWRSVQVKDAMRHIKTEYFVEVGTPLFEAKEMLKINKIGVVAVINDAGKLVGVIQRGRIRRRS